MLPRLKTQALTQGAFFAALMTVLGVLGIYAPPLFFLTNLVIPVILAVLVRRQSLQAGVAALIVFSILVLLFVGPKLAVVILIFQTAPLGLVLGLLFKNHASAGISIVFSCVTLAVFTLFGLAVSIWVTGNNPLMAGEEVKQAMAQVADWYARVGLTERLPRNELEKILAETAVTVSQLIPAHLVIWSFISAFLTYFLARQALVKLAYSPAPLPPFAQWQVPWYISWGVIAGLGLTLAGDSLKIFPAAVLGKNMLYVSGFLYFVAGLAVCNFYLTKWSVSRLVKFFFIGLAVFYLPFVVVALAVLGILDSFFDLRRSRSGKKGKDR
ncbi:MAG: YybS family protein [Firmicutes bacterium]|nr:YybS family protein [Bacillota bacterium]